MFLVGCIPARLALVWIAARRPARWMAFPAAAVALGLAVIHIKGLRPTGIETGGRPIWWDGVRPVHALMYALFAALVWEGDDRAWVPLALDVMLGIAVFARRYSS